MHHALFVNMLQAEQRLIDESDRFGSRQTFTALQYLVERFAFEIFHHEEVQFRLVLAKLKGTNYMRVFELDGKACFAFEAREQTVRFWHAMAAAP